MAKAKTNSKAKAKAKELQPKDGFIVGVTEGGNQVYLDEKDFFVTNQQHLAKMFGCGNNSAFLRDMKQRRGEAPPKYVGLGYSLLQWIEFVRADDRAKLMREIQRNRVREAKDSDAKEGRMTPGDMKRLLEVQRLQLDLEERRATLIPREHVETVWSMLSTKLRACSKQMAKRFPQAKKLLDQTFDELKREIEQRFSDAPIKKEKRGRGRPRKND